MTWSWNVYVHEGGCSWKVFAKCDDFFHAAWIRDRLVETGFFPESDTDITKERKSEEVKQ